MVAHLQTVNGRVRGLFLRADELLIVATARPRAVVRWGPTTSRGGLDHFRSYNCVVPCKMAVLASSYLRLSVLDAARIPLKSSSTREAPRRSGPLGFSRSLERVFPTVHVHRSLMVASDYPNILVQLKL
jgi:hypothetical protein